MGTSSSYGGPSGSNPLVPSWLETPTSGGDIEADKHDISSPQNDLANSAANGQPLSSDPNRFRGPRANYTQFIRSGGNDTAKLGRALSGYVSKAMGGAKGATAHMGTSKKTSARLANFVSVASGHGLSEALKRFDLSHLIGRKLSDVLHGLVDTICPAGGNIDESIAREAFVEMVCELTTKSDVNFESVSQEQLDAILETYICRTIESRICNDIANKSIGRAQSVYVIEHAQGQLRDFIQTSVSMALKEINIKSGIVTDREFQKIVAEIYEKSFLYMEIIGSTAGEEK